ncbi:MAG: hypothetical protein R8M37_02220 [Alphaproteobacteria bacterium]|nr:hypothetical protein [Alphaproteobacteria bacterium]
MAGKFFNPDVEVVDIGSLSPHDLKRAEQKEEKRTEFDPDTDCPYDRTLCRQKLVRFNRWARAVEWAAENKCDTVFCTSEDMFHNCPVPELNCVRRLRYEMILAQQQQKKK